MKKLLTLILTVSSLNLLASDIYPGTEYIKLTKIKNDRYEMQSCLLRKVYLYQNQEIMLGSFLSNKSLFKKFILSNKRECLQALKEMKKTLAPYYSDHLFWQKLQNSGCEMHMAQDKEYCQELIHRQKSCYRLGDYSKTQNTLSNEATARKIVAGVLFFPAAFFPNEFENSKHLLEDMTTQIVGHQPETIKIGLDSLDYQLLRIESYNSYNVLLNSSSERYYLAPSARNRGLKFMRLFTKIFTWDYAREPRNPSKIDVSCQ